MIYVLIYTVYLLLIVLLVLMMGPHESAVEQLEDEPEAWLINPEDK